MKKIILVAVLMVLAVVGFSQKDTLFNVTLPQEIMFRGITATYYKDMYDDETKSEKLINFYILFRGDSLIIFNDDRKEKDYVIINTFESRRLNPNQELLFYDDTTSRYEQILITVVKDYGQLAHVALSNGTYLVIFHIVKLIDMEALKINNEKDSIYTNNYNYRISSSFALYEGLQRSPISQQAVSDRQPDFGKSEDRQY